MVNQGYIHGKSIKLGRTITVHRDLFRVVFQLTFNVTGKLDE